MGTYPLGAQPPRWVCRRAQVASWALVTSIVFLSAPPPPSPSLHICAHTAANVSHKPGLWPQVITIYLRLYA